MTIEEIKSLINEFKESDLTLLQIKEGNFELLLESAKEMPCPPARPLHPPHHFREFEQHLGPVDTNFPKEMPLQQSSSETITAPMVGTFYQASSPESSPFVNIGDKVKKGQIICIIEAMKLMNEVESDKDGVIQQILVEDGQMVEFGEPLFVVE